MSLKLYRGCHETTLAVKGYSTHATQKHIHMGMHQHTCDDDDDNVLRTAPA